MSEYNPIDFGFDDIYPEPAAEQPEGLIQPIQAGAFKTNDLKVGFGLAWTAIAGGDVIVATTSHNPDLSHPSHRIAVLLLGLSGLRQSTNIVRGRPMLS